MTSTPASQPRPRRRWIWIIVASVTTLAVALPGGLRVWLKADMQHRDDPVVTFRRSIVTLQLNASSDNISVSAGRPGQVTVASTLSWVFGRPVVAEVWHGETLDVSVRCPRPDLFADCGASLVLTVPASVAVRADVGSGNITVAGLSGPQHLATTSGTITLGNVSGPVWASASSGSISGQRDLTASRLDAVVSSGAVALTFGAAPEQLSLAVGSGVAHVTLPPGAGYRVIRRSGPGQLYIAPGLSDPRATRLISAMVGTGMVSVSDPGSRAG